MKKEDPPHGDRLADDFLNIAVFRVGLRFTNQGSRGKCTCHCDRLRIAAKGVLGMPLSDANLKELETMGAPQVRLHVSQWSGRGLGADIGGFKTGDMLRGDILDWLVAKDRAEKRFQGWMLFWASVQIRSARYECPLWPLADVSITPLNVRFRE